MFLRDQIKKVGDAVYRNVFTKRFSKRTRRRTDNDSLSLDLTEHSYTENENLVRLSVPFLKKTYTASYKYPSNVKALRKAVDDAYFEITTLKGRSIDDALEDLFDVGPQVRKEEKMTKAMVDDAFDNPTPPTKESLEVKDSALALLDIIQEENDLTRFQAYYVFSRVFVSGVPAAEKTGHLIEEAIEKVREYMASSVDMDKIRQLQPKHPFPKQHQAPIGVRASGPVHTETRVRDLSGSSPTINAPSDISNLDDSDE
jgi:hypothetical protein